jgi:hypothetical protein
MSRRPTFAHLCMIFRRPFFRRFVRGAALASILGVIVCPQVSCMVPQTIDAIVESPHPAPHIVLETIPSYLLARVLTLYQQGSTDLAASPRCHCRLEFDALSVQEQDSTVTLEARWFIDYDPANLPSTRIAFSEQIAANFDNVTQTVRPLRTFVFDATAAGIVSSGLHVVEVVIGETTGFDPSSTTLPNRAMKPGFTASTYKFVVDVHLENFSGQCDGPTFSPSPPAHRVCQ